MMTDAFAWKIPLTRKIILITAALCSITLLSLTYSSVRLPGGQTRRRFDYERRLYFLWFCRLRHFGNLRGQKKNTVLNIMLLQLLSDATKDIAGEETTGTLAPKLFQI